MTTRRDVVFGAACVAAAAGAWALTPRRRVSLLGSRNLEALIPATVGVWRSQSASDLLAPVEPGDLASRLYDAIISRLYLDLSSGAEVAALFAHGPTQSEELQIHRPEICYPAYGFAISGDSPARIPLGADAAIPARSFVAGAGGRRQTVLYWTRLGEFLPTTRREQQIARLRTAMDGEVADGVLVRLSMDDVEPAAALAIMTRFAAELLRAAGPAGRAALVGLARAAAMSRIR